MLKIENVVTPSPEQWRSTIMGARNAMNSWDRSDSGFVMAYTEYHLGPNDHDLLMRLRNAGTDHRKFMRMLPVHMDIIAPFYWWKEFSTYKVGTVANSCSTMHKIAAKEFTLEDFSHEHLSNFSSHPEKVLDPLSILKSTIVTLNSCRHEYLETKDEFFWWQMIQLLPSSYNQRRTVMLNYEVLANIYKSRKGHKLDEWGTFCEWIEGLPYSELITGEKERCDFMKTYTEKEEWPSTIEEASKAFEEFSQAIDKIRNPDKE